MSNGRSSGGLFLFLYLEVDGDIGRVMSNGRSSGGLFLFLYLEVDGDIGRVMSNGRSSGGLFFHPVFVYLKSFYASPFLLLLIS